MKIIINAREHEVTGERISFERVCELAGQPTHASCTYSGPRRGDIRREGELYDGKSVELESGMVFNVGVTGNA